MAKHICDLYDLIRSNSETNLQRNWKEVENRIKTQLPLRVMSCVQLASKLTSHYKVSTQKLLQRQYMCFILSTVWRPFLKYHPKNRLIVLTDNKKYILTPQNFFLISLKALQKYLNFVLKIIKVRITWANILTAGSWNHERDYLFKYA